MKMAAQNSSEVELSANRSSRGCNSAKHKFKMRYYLLLFYYLSEMNPEVNKLGRLVQCRCHHTCNSHDLGYQWLLPRTKSKHMLFERVKNKQVKKKGNFMFWYENTACNSNPSNK